MGRIATFLIRKAEELSRTAHDIKRNAPGLAAQTRFSAAEHELLLQAAADAGVDEHAFLGLCVQRQWPKVADVPPLSDEEAYAATQLVTHERRDMAAALQDAVVVDSREVMTDREKIQARDYGLRAGCRTAFAARRHAFIAEMRDQGKISADTEIPTGFAGSVV